MLQLPDLFRTCGFLMAGDGVSDFGALDPVSGFGVQGLGF